MNRKQQGIVSYAGMDVATLLAGARLMFADGGDQLPARFSSLMPLFPVELIQSMPFVGVAQPGQNVAPGGFSIDPATYHCMLYEQMPRLYAGDNLRRNLDGEGVFHGHGVVTVDEAWTTCFPQYQPFAGERLAIYPLGGGAQVAAVPASLYPQAGGFLRQAETALGITRRCHDYAHYVYQRIRSGQSFDAEVFENEYLQDRGLNPVILSQSDLGRMMQDLSMLKSIREGSETDGLYTENAKRAEHILQYVPGLYACDVFEDTPITRYTARLAQPVWEDGFVSDFWMPYADAAAYASQDRATLDMAALCQGFQMAPVYDPVTRGGRYPDRLRVVIIRDKELRLRTADTLNNPAYGSGMSPAGAINKRVYLPGSREWLRQGKLMEEESPFRCENTAISAEDYRQMVALAAVQEHKGRLVDALYRRESVLGEVNPIAADYGRLHDLMSQPVEKLEGQMDSQGSARLSGYDADMDYLRRMGLEREWVPGPKKQKDFRFAPDGLRQASIESGFAMRAACLRADWSQLALGEACQPVEAATVDEPDSKAAPCLDYAQALTQPAGALGPDQAPLWLNAADPWHLTTDVGGLYPTDEALRKGADVPKPGQKAAAEPDNQPEPEAPKPKKKKKSPAKGKKAKADTAQAARNGGFSDEEMQRRQVKLDWPAEEAADKTVLSTNQPGTQPETQPAAPTASQPDKAVPPAELTAGADANQPPEPPEAQAPTSANQPGTQPETQPAAPTAFQPDKAADPPEPSAPNNPDPTASLQEMKNGQMSFFFDQP